MREDDLPEPGGRRDFVSPGRGKNLAREFHDMQKNCRHELLVC